MSSEKSNSSAVSGRSKPRLVKIRRQMGSQQGKSSNNSGLKPFQSVLENSNQVNNATSSSSNGFNSLVGDVDFVFGSHKNSLMSNLNSEKEQCTGSAEGFGSFNNVGFVFGVNKSNSDSNSHSEHKESSGGVGELGADVGFVFGANKSSSLTNSDLERRPSSGNVQQLGADEFGELNYGGFVFGAKKSNSDSNSHSEHKESSGGVGELGADVGFVFGANKSSSLTNSDLERRPSSGNVQQLGADEFGELNYGGFVFGAKKSNSDSNSHSEHKESSGGVGELGADVGFVFGANKSSSLTNSDLERRPSSGNVQQLGADEFGELNYGGFVFGAKKSNSDSNSHSEHKESSGGVGELGADVGFVFGANKSSSLTNSDLERRPSSGNVQQLGADEFGELNYGGFVFGAKKSNSDSNSHSEHKESSGGVGELGADVGFVFGANKSSSLTNSDLERRPSSGNVQQLGADEFGELNYGGFVFGAKKSNSDSNSHSEHKESSGGVGELGADVGFVFGANKSSSLTNSDLERRPSSGNVQQLGADEFGELNYGGFVFGAKKSNSFTANLYNGLNKKLEFCEKSISIKDKTGKKTRRKLRQAIPVQQQSRQNCVSKEGSQQNPDSPACYSPMDFSPYHDNSCAPSAVNATSSTCASDEDLAAAREGPNTSEDDKKCRGKHDEVSKNHYERFVAHSSLEEAETECSNFKSEQKTINRGGGVAEDSVNSDRKREESECVKQFCFASSVEDISVRNFTFSVSSAQDNFSATKRQNRKKYRMKVGHGPNCTTPSQKVDTASSSVQSSPLDSGYLHRIRAQDKEGDIFSSQRKGENKSKGGEEHDKKGSTAATLEACEKWRIRGNQAYEKGYMSEAEEFYTKGRNCVLHSEKSGCCVEPLVLCYSNRAAARMSRGRMREALGDCMMAASLDPTFQKVQIRAANCHLALGEVEGALQYFSKCVESGSHVCLDRRIIIEAANGLQNAQKVAECMNQCAKLLQQRTSNAAISALEIISQVLSISSYSEKLLEMKGEALLMLRRYEEVIQLCEQTLVFAEKNFAVVTGDNNIVNVDGLEYKNSSIRLWRWLLISKSYFYLGRLDEALDLLEKQELLRSTEDRHGRSTRESSIPFAVTVRELLHRKGMKHFSLGGIQKQWSITLPWYQAVLNHVLLRPFVFATICFCNRAAAHQSLGQIADAIADCSPAIALDGSYSKFLEEPPYMKQLGTMNKQPVTFMD
ncbi:uncharacterized protein LOC114294576 isoform X2 [Camellia sinensis]|uniref:uncharacterized protein LOC114294576 isoform X2 n=1 Tax=Camellia sinensis TaxID=4442 RepID=UPI001036942B|nr:uncharacterized protein LOC114294576 isoform X2 [Camellia sinensis]